MEGTCFVALLIYTPLPRADTLQRGAEPGVQRPMFFFQSRDDILQQTGRQLNIQRDRHSNKQIDCFYITGVFNRLFKNLSQLQLSLTFLSLPPLISLTVHPPLHAFTPALLAFAFNLSSQSVCFLFFPQKIKATSRLRSVTS